MSDENPNTDLPEHPSDDVPESGSKSSENKRMRRRRKQRKRRSEVSSPSLISILLDKTPVIGVIRAHHRGERFGVPKRGRRRTPNRLRKKIAWDVVKLLVVFGLLGGIVYWLTNGDPDEGRPSVANPDGEPVLSEMEPAELLVKYGETIINEKASLPQRISTAFERVDLAEAMAGTDDPGIQYTGRRAVFEDNAIIGLICLDEGMPLNESVMEFLESADEDPSEDTGIAALQKCCVAFASIFKASATRNDQSAWSLANGKFNDAVALAVNDPVSARLLFSIAGIVQSKNLANPSSHFLNTANEAFSGSRVDAVRDVSSAYMNRFTQAERATMLMARANSILEQVQFEEADYTRLYEAGFQLLKAGRFYDASDMLERAKEKMHLENAPDAIGEKLELLETWCGLHMQPLDLTGVRTFEDQVPERTTSNASRRLIYISQLDRASESIARFNALATALSNQIRSGEAAISVIIVYDSSQPGDFGDIETASRMFPVFDFWKVDSSTDEGRALLERYPPLHYPFAILLDNREQVTGVEPDVQMLQDDVNLDITRQ
ncbi:MAG: hypothetical protein AAF456_02765 [Planctomycetota bacterium]